MSRYDPKMTAAAPAPDELDELLLALGSAAGAGIDRRDALLRRDEQRPVGLDHGAPRRRGEAREVTRSTTTRPPPNSP